eukprot:jgi/Mesvir1/26544/Mv16199-RA.1
MSLNNISELTAVQFEQYNANGELVLTKTAANRINNNWQLPSKAITDLEVTLVNPEVTTQLVLVLGAQEPAVYASEFIWYVDGQDSGYAGVFGKKQVDTASGTKWALVCILGCVHATTAINGYSLSSPEVEIKITNLSGSNKLVIPVPSAAWTGAQTQIAATIPANIIIGSESNSSPISVAWPISVVDHTLLTGSLNSITFIESVVWTFSGEGYAETRPAVGTSGFVPVSLTLPHYALSANASLDVRLANTGRRALPAGPSLSLSPNANFQAYISDYQLPRNVTSIQVSNAFNVSFRFVNPWAIVLANNRSDLFYSDTNTLRIVIPPGTLTVDGSAINTEIRVEWTVASKDFDYKYTFKDSAGRYLGHEPERLTDTFYIVVRTNRAVTLNPNRVQLSVSTGSPVTMGSWTSSTDGKEHELPVTGYSTHTSRRTLTIEPNVATDGTKLFTDANGQRFVIRTHTVVMEPDAPTITSARFVTNLGQPLAHYNNNPSPFDMVFDLWLTTSPGANLDTLDYDDVTLRHYDIDTRAVTRVPSWQEYYGGTLAPSSSMPANTRSIKFIRNWHTDSPGLLVAEILPKSFGHSGSTAVQNPYVFATHFVGKLPLELRRW